MNIALEIAFKKSVQDGTAKDKEVISNALFGKKPEIAEKKPKGKK
jgi:hypothetical protein